MGEGTVVRYIDEYRQPHQALITKVWNQDENGAPTYVNLIYVSSDESKTDPYGRQTERATSVPVKDDNNGAGRYFETL